MRSNNSKRSWSDPTLAVAIVFFGVALSACGDESQGDAPRCSTNADCESGYCNGQGCGKREGTCYIQGETCLDKDMTVCGCDGEVHQGSPCTVGRWVHEGSCEAGQGSGDSQSRDGGSAP